MNNFIACFSLSFVLFACASSSSTPEPGVGSNANGVQEKSGADISGTWAFVLDASDPSSMLRGQCAVKAGCDKAKADACYAEAREEAAHEKIRFTKMDDGTSTYTAFDDLGGGKEKVYVTTKLTLASDGPTTIHATMPNGTTVQVELVDAKTLALNDPKKGRLVFTKE